MSDPTGASAPASREQNLQWALQQIEALLRDLRYGALTLVVQDGVIVQVERTERHRYRRSQGAEPA
jgi:hypothetical protein